MNMMTRREVHAALGAAFAALFAGTAAALGAQSAAQQNPQESKPSNPPRGVATLLQQSLGELGDSDATMLILTVPPRRPASADGHSGRAFPMHKHSGPVFAYVLEGQVENQVDPDELKTYNAGDFWYEPAMHVHRLLRNLSDTRPARILVFEVLPKDKPAAYPVQ
jgi:quercetin dioxygenase-like cupin family protein